MKATAVCWRFPFCGKISGGCLRADHLPEDNLVDCYPHVCLSVETELQIATVLVQSGFRVGCYFHMFSQLW